MKFVANSKELSATLSAVAKFVSNKSVIPILDNVYMVVKDGELEMRATDLETTIISKMSIEHGEDGVAAIPAKTLAGALKEFKDGLVTIEFDNDLFSVNITAGEGEYAIVGSNPADYPETPIDVDYSVPISKTTIIDIVDKVAFAAKEDELRPLLSGVLFENKNNSLNVVATDSHYMAVMTLDGYEDDWDLVIKKHALISLKGLLGKNIESVEMGFNDKNVVFMFGKTTMISRLIDGKYPNYFSVIPKDNDKEIVAVKDDVLSAIKRLSMFGNPNYPVISFDFSKDAAKMRCQDIDRAMRGVEKLACNYNDGDMTIGFNGTRLSDILGAISSVEFQMTLKSPERAALIYPMDSNVKYLLMPVVVQS